MRTDIPLKRLTLLRAADLLPLLGERGSEIVAVETLELPATATRLDNVLRLRDTQGREHLHVIEWQAYNDTAVLWRFVGYLAWLGQRAPELPITGTLVYLSPAADMGNELRQIVNDQPVLRWPIPTLRLWEQDAQAALAGANLGLVVLSPLMQGATEALVEQAALRVLAEAPTPQQADLLSILGVFAEPLFDSERFKRLVGKERLMASDLLTSLVEEKTAELEEKLAEKTAEFEEKLAEKDAVILQSLRQTLEEAVIARFPDAPLALAHDIRQVRDQAQLQRLIVEVIRAADLDAFRGALVTHQPGNGH